MDPPRFRACSGPWVTAPRAGAVRRPQAGSNAAGVTWLSHASAMALA